MTYTIPYGSGNISVRLPPRYRVREYLPQQSATTACGDGDIRRALRAFLVAAPPARPVASVPGAAPTPAVISPPPISVAIAINDKSRPAIQNRILPLLIPELQRACAAPLQITLCIANGLHPPAATAAERAALIPPGYERYRIVHHDARQRSMLAFLGTSAAHSPVWINRIFHEAQYKITISAVEGHQFVGVTGGAKMVAIGLGGAETITHNHSLHTHPHARVGRITDNPVRQDIEEIGRMAGVDMQINCALNVHQQIMDLQVFDAEQRNADTTFAQFADAVLQTRRLPSRGNYDCVIVAAGGHPKDENLYQLQKALAHAAPLARPQAPIVLCGACVGGVGDKNFAAHFSRAAGVEQVLAQQPHEEFKIGMHKSALFARDMRYRTVALLSALPRKEAAALHFLPLRPTGRAVARFLRRCRLRRGARVAVVPYAATCYFAVTT